MKHTIRLRGMNGSVQGRMWESADAIRVGRVDALEIVLNDSSVSRYHAEIRATDRGWRVRDLGSTNGTSLNGVRLGNGQWPLRPRDLIQFGDVALIVETLSEVEDRPVQTPTGVAAVGAQGAHALRSDTSSDAGGFSDELRVEGTAKSSWDQAFEGLAYDSNRCLRAGEQLQALFRASRHLVNIEKEEELLQSTLNDAVTVLDAQRGALVLLEGPEQKLKLRALVSGRNEPRAMLAGRNEPGGRFQFSHSLAARCVSRGESILCQRVDEDAELALAKSIAEGAMASVLCVLLRTPRRRLGVLHLDRSPWQKPFTMEDLHLADALAASVSAGIECCQLMRKQRDLFLDTITILAQAVELRDKYTGGHTNRVGAYSLLLAEQLGRPEPEVELIRIGTPLHDIGKIGIDDAILRKPDKLTIEEFEIMKTHTTKGAEIINTVPDLRPVLPIVRSHHERWDGKGYPDGLAGEDTPAMARIVAIADAFDAMTSDRPYRKGLPVTVAFAEIEKHAGKQFDPDFAVAFLALRERITQEMQANVEPPISPSRRMQRLVLA